MAIWRYYYI